MSEILCHCRGCDVARKQGADEVKVLIENIHRLYMDTAFEPGMSEDLYNFLDKLRDILDSEK